MEERKTETKSGYPAAESVPVQELFDFNTLLLTNGILRVH